MKYALLTVLVMLVPWVGLSWLGWHNSRQMRAVFPGGEGRLFLAILLATIPWFMLASLSLPTGNLMAALTEGRAVEGWAVAATALLFAAVALGLVLSRKLVATYMRLRAVQGWGGDLRQAAAEAAKAPR